MNWYALYVESGREEMVQALIRKYLDESAIRALVPKRKIRERRQGQYFDVFKTLFPGYVLVQTHMDANMYYNLKKLPKYYRLLNKYKYSSNRDKDSKKFDNAKEDSENDGEKKFLEPTNLFFEINEDEIALILQLIGDEEVIEYSTVYVINTEVIVQSGPLKGMEGNIKKIDKRKNRAKIVLDFMGNKKIMDVGIEILAKKNQ